MTTEGVLESTREKMHFANGNKIKENTPILEE